MREGWWKERRLLSGHKGIWGKRKALEKEAAKEQQAE
jgi:hypothetical protein